MEVHMKASVVDLRYKMNDVLKALDRGEKVTLLYHGKIKGTIVPVISNQMTSVAEHPFFNMAGEESADVSQEMDALRGSRFNDI
jgi:antitoxin (DNA-binding transcriptional repressor) of toxin-antitoxin stability system